MLYCVFLKQVFFRKKFIAMDDLRQFFISIGFSNPKIIMATGNVIISSEQQIQELYNKIKNALSDYYFYDIDIFIKTFVEIEKIIKNNPFEIENGYYNHTFLVSNTDFSKVLFDEFSKQNLIDKENFSLIDNVVYWKLFKSNRFTSNILKLLSRNSLKHNFTLRTIGTLSKIYNGFSNYCPTPIHKS